eukprot:2737398-Rhodomonas_salina.2
MLTLIGKLQMAEGDETLAKQLKVCIAKGLSRFEPEPSEDYNCYAKRSRLNPSIPPAVAFTAEDVNEFVTHAYTAGEQGSASVNPNIVCWNCNCISHQKAVCPHPPCFDINSNRGFQVGGVRGVGGVGGAGRAGGNYGGHRMHSMQGSSRNMRPGLGTPGLGTRYGMPGLGTQGSGARYGMQGLGTPGSQTLT